MIPTTDHNEDLAPDDSLSGVLINHQWRQIIVPILYEGLYRYLKDITDETEQQTFISRVDALIDDIYTPVAMANYRQAERGTTQAIPANTLTKIQFQTGANPPQDWDVPASYDGICTITARVWMNGGTGLKYARLLHNGNEIVRADFRSTGTVQFFQMSHVLEVVSTDVFNLEVYSLQATTVQVADFTPKISMVIV